MVPGRFHGQTYFLHEIPGRLLADAGAVGYLDTRQALATGAHLVNYEEGLAKPEPDPVE